MNDHVHIGEGEVWPTLPWPFPGNVFPQDLGAVVMRTVLYEEAPALQVIHTEEGYWGIADGVGDPNRNIVATHIWHVVGRDRTLAELATLPPGQQADRNSASEPWVISPLVLDPPTRWQRLRKRLDTLRSR